MNRLLIAVSLIVVVGCHAAPDFTKVGGTKLTYQVDETEDKVDAEAGEKAMTRRLDPLGRLGIKVQVEDGKLEISIPNGQGHAERVEMAKRIATAIAELRFQIIADNTDVQLATAVAGLAPEDDSREVIVNEKTIGCWHPVAMDETGAPMLNLDPTANFTRQPKGKLETLLKVSPLDIQGKHLKSVSKGFDDSMRPCINFALNVQGAKVMKGLTKSNNGRRLAVILDGKVVSGPVIMSEIAERGQIAGRFTPEFVDDMVAVLRAGAMPFTLMDTPPKVEQVSAK